MNIAVIGAGNIGGTLGRKWAAAGHSVWFGVRDPGKPGLAEQVAELGPEVRAVPVAEAVRSGEVIVFAVPGPAVDSIVQEHATALAGRVLIDASNNMRGESRHALASLRAAAPTASLFRAFNSLGWENLDRPEFDGVCADLFYCGDEAGRQTVEGLIEDVGLNPICVGGVEQVGLVEGMTDMWFALAMRQKLGRRIAFKVLGV